MSVLNIIIFYLKRILSDLHYLFTKLCLTINVNSYKIQKDVLFRINYCFAEIIAW